MGVTPVPAHVCMTIADELAEREEILSFYNLPEAKDRDADRFSALSLIKTVCIQSLNPNKLSYPFRKKDQR